MTVTKRLDGGILIEDIHHGQYIKYLYYNYTVQEAKKLFRNYREEISHNGKI